MAARKVNTPGAPEKAPEPVSTAEQADAALEHITGQDAESQDQSTNETSSLGTPVEPTAEELAAKKEYEEFLQWRKNKGEAVKPAKATAQPFQSQAAEVKRIQNVLTDRGWDSVEE
ncbi:hypothetical protein [Acinetobacter pseudolwoffii]|uniref:hypothetical protein n=1 Tax=Acinetobacter pseudolwoffii TaxID=2053287 RepID=UPI0021E3CE2A|nr:hypothetical protein [Acinetobacter pseudolwoffii]